jgi:poly(R)-hydroxyalkanoic acid synthase, class I
VNAPSPPAWPVPVGLAPEALADIQADFLREWARLSQAASEGRLEPAADRRFAAKAWQDSPVHTFLAHAYLLSAKTMLRMVDAAEVSEPLRERLRFSVMQWLDALSPANFLALNPDALQAVIDSGGQALYQGAVNLLQDLRKGRISQTDESRFEVGRNLAVTPGSVVFENRLFQLIQYRPATPQVYRRPLVIVPPCINKYYVLDLQPENSFVRHAVGQGHTVFMMSWRNPLPNDDDGVDQATWLDYLDEGVLRALAVAADICGQDQVNALGFCVGGTLLASALALAQARGHRPAASLTLLTCLLDYRDTGVLRVFVDEGHARLREQQLGAGGLMSARELAATFSFLRPNELVWNYVVSNYLKGQTPPAFDLLYWNADGTNLPGPFFAWYFRNTYLENNLKEPGRIKLGGHGLDLTSLDMPAYVYGSREDHIVPWKSAYDSTSLLRGPCRFVLGASGHIAGVINPPAQGRRSHWVGDDEGRPPGDPEAWLARAEERPGSWWPDWSKWLSAMGGGKVRARSRLGNARHRPIEPAPGRYVKVRAL